jgi:hypothetical protein
MTRRIPESVITAAALVLNNTGSDPNAQRLAHFVLQQHQTKRCYTRAVHRTIRDVFDAQTRGGQPKKEVFKFLADAFSKDISHIRRIVRDTPTRYDEDAVFQINAA